MTQVNFTATVTIPPEVIQAARFVAEHSRQISREANEGNEKAQYIAEVVTGLHKPKIFKRLVDAVQAYQAGMVCPICGHVGYRHLCL